MVAVVEKFAQFPVGTLQTYWDSRASKWQTHEILTEYFVRLVREALSPPLTTLSTNDSILDVASGANPFHYFPAELKTRMHSIDLSPAALALNPAAKRIMADVRNSLPFRDNSFALITCIFGMRYFRNQEKVIDEMVRLLKPRGQLVIIDFKNSFNEVAVRDFEAEKLQATTYNHAVRLESKRLFPGNPECSPIDMLTGIKL